jgi:radical SAM superfamily enzyme YgiQ (UPF0313 family)
MVERRRVALVCMTPGLDGSEARDHMPSYGIRRIQAAVVADPALADVEVRLFDHPFCDEDYFVREIEEFAPDIVGFSVYLWSQMLFVNVARRLKQSDPSRLIVFGGPSARKELLDLAPYQRAEDYVDAVVPREGELIFRSIVGMERVDPTGLTAIGGLDLPRGAGWISTGLAPVLARLDDVPSPFQLGLMAHRKVGYLETFRGCPMSCAFCEWGVADRASMVFSEEYITRELTAMRDAEVTAVFSIDAGLNLNAKAFRNLVAAEERVGLLKSLQGFSIELYPSYLNDLQIEFLKQTKPTYVGVGLQSISNEVLDGLGRPFKHKNLTSVLERLGEIVMVDVQIIFGLPGDSPDSFKRTLDAAMKLPCSALRIYHCLVLPDALMTRSKPEWNVRFDPIKLSMTSCLGWSETDILKMREYVKDFASSVRGFHSGEYWWTVPIKSAPDSPHRKAANAHGSV